MTRHHHANTFHRCGDIVRERDGRHEGRVEAMFDRKVKVRWESGFISFLDFEDVERADNGRVYLLEA